MQAVYKSDKGQIRETNEDSGGLFYNRGGQLLAVVADGMGGHQAGDVASQMATEEMKSYWEEAEAFNDIRELDVWLDTVIQTMNDTLRDYAQQRQELAGMGTTLVAAAFVNQTVVVAHVGDSRLYHVTNETIEQKTYDHSFVNELVLQGQITQEEAEYHPKKNILTRALGTSESIAVDVVDYEWHETGYVLLCTDGLTNKVSDRDLLDMLLKHDTIEQSVDELLHEANERGGDDNITAIVVELTPDEAGDPTWS
ncbi:protein phosphatase [Alkalibacillus flavidus]|uniref:Protein phosphatase n=1 Tax=Alkalibacillus flavidus TaxID=546021 RepID=A0ABV2KR83_9BACI